MYRNYICLEGKKIMKIEPKIFDELKSIVILF